MKGADKANLLQHSGVFCFSCISPFLSFKLQEMLTLCAKLLSNTLLEGVINCNIPPFGQKIDKSVALRGGDYGWSSGLLLEGKTWEEIQTEQQEMEQQLLFLVLNPRRCKLKNPGCGQKENVAELVPALSQNVLPGFAAELGFVQDLRAPEEADGEG